MLTDYWRNKLIDASLRNQAITFPATRYIALFTVLPTPSTGGTELSATGYVRQTYGSSLTSWSGTQGAGTTGVSSGTSGQSSNNVAVEIHEGVPVAWTGIVGWGLFDASTAGNLLEFGYIVDADENPITRSFSVGDPVSFSEGTLISRWS